MFSRQVLRLAARSIPQGGQRMLSSQRITRKTRQAMSPFLALALSGAAGGALLVIHSFTDQP